MVPLIPGSIALKATSAFPIARFPALGPVLGESHGAENGPADEEDDRVPMAPIPEFLENIYIFQSIIRLCAALADAGNKRINGPSKKES